jgi:hypothetical protein
MACAAAPPVSLASASSVPTVLVNAARLQAGVAEQTHTVALDVTRSSGSVVLNHLLYRLLVLARPRLLLCLLFL